MEVIPVIDLMHGLVVHARLGQRHTYQPLVSPLCKNAEPETVVAGLLRLHPFQTIYLADLDALTGGSPQTPMVEKLRKLFPEIVFWIDRGLPEAGKSPVFPMEQHYLPVVGSESLEEADLLMKAGFDAHFILSLDFMNGKLLGPECLLQQPEWWPEKIILMNLSRVGGTEGPHYEQAEDFISQYSRHKFIAAGGVRDCEDLLRLKNLGVSGVLLASALHGGRVDRDVLAEIQGG